MFPVRLACVKHAASVHPEPGSNSLIKFVLLKTTTSYLSFLLLLVYKTVLKNVKKFSRIVCVSLFSYQGSLFLLSCDSSFTLSHLQSLVKNFFQILFDNFFDVLKCFALSRQLVYFTILHFSCQQVFSFFSQKKRKKIRPAKQSGFSAIYQLP